MIDVLDTQSTLSTFVLWAPRQKTMRNLVTTIWITSEASIISMVKSVRNRVKHMGENIIEII